MLSDPEQRKRYDAFGEDFRRVPPTWTRAFRQQRAYAAPVPGTIGWAGAWGGGAGTPGGARFDFGEDIDLEDLLGGMFGGRGRTGWGPIPGADQETEVESASRRLTTGRSAASRSARRTVRAPSM